MKKWGLLFLATTLMLGGAALTVKLSVFRAAAKPTSKVTEMEREKLESCQVVPCVTASLQAITKADGPQVALDVLQAYMQHASVGLVGDGHQRAHEIGRATAMRSGITGQAFLSCPTSFNYGCQHGFFEQALIQNNSPRQAIDLICGQLDKDPKYSSKFKFYCYHGVGHGLMMAQAYDLKAALDVCDSLTSPQAADGCWQGVFMEDFVGYSQGQARTSDFPASDVLAPCDVVATKYQNECYLNSASRIIGLSGGQVPQATAACLKAALVSSCLQSIGLMTTNPGWQPNLLHHQASSLEAGAWELCQQFAGGHTGDCVIAAVDNLLNMDELDVGRAKTFCSLIDVSWHADCYSRIGLALNNQTTDKNVVQQRCSQFAPADERSCKIGAGLAS